MKTIAHLSDLHFGTEDWALVEALLDELRHREPTLVVVSGDVTQRARVQQFTAARAFLKRIRQPTLVVPGNHDVPLGNVLQRLLQPFGSYRRYITTTLAPSFRDDELAVLGLNTARATSWKRGRISRAQIEQIRSFFVRTPERLLKVVVTHHPFMPPPNDPRAALVGRRAEALQTAEASGVDLMLAGHLHRGYSGDLRAHYVQMGRSILVVQAGTALSHRTRAEPNAYNLVRIDGPRLWIAVRAWTGGQFVTVKTSQYDKYEQGWRRVTDAPGVPGRSPPCGA